MGLAIDSESHDELKRQLAQCEADGGCMAAEIERLLSAVSLHSEAAGRFGAENERLREAMKGATVITNQAGAEVNRLTARNAEHEERYDALEAKEEFHRREAERMRAALEPFAECSTLDEAEVDLLVSKPGAVAAARSAFEQKLDGDRNG